MTVKAKAERVISILGERTFEAIAIMKELDGLLLSHGYSVKSYNRQRIRDWLRRVAEATEGGEDGGPPA